MITQTPYACPACSVPSNGVPPAHGLTGSSGDALADARREARPRYSGEVDLRRASETFWRMMVTADRRQVNKQRGALRLLRRKR